MTNGTRMIQNTNKLFTSYFYLSIMDTLTKNEGIYIMTNIEKLSTKDLIQSLKETKSKHEELTVELERRKNFVVCENFQRLFQDIEEYAKKYNSNEMYYNRIKHVYSDYVTCEYAYVVAGGFRYIDIYFDDIYHLG